MFKKKKKKIELSDMMSDFMGDIKIESNFVELESKDKILGIKIEPQDVFTKQNELVSVLFNRLAQVYNSCDFDLYKAFVFSPNSFATHENRLVDIYNDENTDTKRKIIIDEDLQKFDEFANTLYKLEFFIMIKGKDDKRLLKNFEILQNTMARAMDFSVLLREDYLNFFAYYFDTDTQFISKAIEKEESIKNSKEEIKKNEQELLTKEFIKAIQSIPQQKGSETYE